MISSFSNSENSGRCQSRSTQQSAHCLQTSRHLNRSEVLPSLPKIAHSSSVGSASIGAFGRRCVRVEVMLLCRETVSAPSEDCESFLCVAKKFSSSSIGGSGLLGAEEACEACEATESSRGMRRLCARAAMAS